MGSARVSEPTLTHKVGAKVVILSGLHKGDNVPVIGSKPDSVIVDVHDMPHLYRIQDVKEARKRA